MATENVMIKLPSEMKQWLQEQAKKSPIGNMSGLVRSLIQRYREEIKERSE